MSASTLLLVLAVVVPTQGVAEESTDPFDIAAAGGERVEIVDERSETDTVFANPDGTITRETSVAPVRIREEQGWKPVDYDLELTPDGRLTPKASPEPAVLSNGGDDPLTEGTTEGVTTSMTLADFELPTPIVDGPSATYPEVLEGVDLRLTVSAAGVSQVFVVKDAEAAASPRLRELVFDTSVEGGELVDDLGRLRVEDELGREVGTFTDPLMWDSSGEVLDADGDPVANHSEAAVEARAEAPADGDEIAGIDVEVDGDEVTFEPDEGALTGEDVEYPVYVDPVAQSKRFAWSMVQAQYPNTTFYKWGDTQGVGYQNYEGVSKKRLFWRTSTSSLPGVKVIKATFTTRQVWAPSCDNTRQVRLYRTGAIDDDTTWNNQPSWGTFQDESTDKYCFNDQHLLEFDVKQGVQSAADSGYSSVTFGMKAESETDPLAWKRFTNMGVLEVTYSRYPYQSGWLQVNGTACGSAPISLGRITEQPVLSALVSDPDADQKVRGRFEIIRKQDFDAVPNPSLRYSNSTPCSFVTKVLTQQAHGVLRLNSERVGVRQLALLA